MTSQMLTITVPIEAYENFLQVQKQIDEESKIASQKALKAAIRNKKNEREGRNDRDSSGNTAQYTAARRALILEHLAKAKLMKALGRADEVPSFAEVWNNYMATNSR